MTNDTLRCGGAYLDGTIQLVALTIDLTREYGGLNGARQGIGGVVSRNGQSEWYDQGKSNNDCNGTHNFRQKVLEVMRLSCVNEVSRGEAFFGLN